jgi:hypothetical protein
MTMGVGQELGQEITNLDFGAIIGAPLQAAVNAQAEAAKTTIKFLQTSCLDDYSEAPQWEPQVSYRQDAAVRNTPGTDEKFYVAKKRVTLGGDAEPGVSNDWELYWKEVGQVNVRSVNFRYDQKVQSGDVASKNAHSVTIPLMTMVPIPYIRIDEMKLDFNVKLSGVQTKDFNIDSDLGVNLSYDSPGSGAARKKKKKKKKNRKLWPTLSINAGWSRQSKKSETETVSRTYTMNVKVRAEQSEVPVGIERMINLLDQLIQEDISETVDN